MGISFSRRFLADSRSHKLRDTAKNSVWYTVAYKPVNKLTSRSATSHRKHAPDRPSLIEPFVYPLQSWFSVCNTHTRTTKFWVDKICMIRHTPFISNRKSNQYVLFVNTASKFLKVFNFLNPIHEIGSQQLLSSSWSLFPLHFHIIEKRTNNQKMSHVLELSKRNLKFDHRNHKNFTHLAASPMPTRIKTK